MREFKAEVHFEESEKVPAYEIKSLPGRKKDILQQIQRQKNIGFDNWIQEFLLLLYPTKQIADNSNQDKIQTLKIRNWKGM